MKNRYAKMLESYESIHKNPINRVIHAIGIPLIMSAVLGLAHLIKTPVIIGGVQLSLALIIAALTLALTLSWAWRAFLAFTPLLFASSVIALSISLDTLGTTAWFWGGCFVLGWGIQFVGHAFEGKSPEFVSRPHNLLLGPISVSLEVLPIFRPVAETDPR